MRNHGRSISKIIFVIVSTFQLLWAAGVEAMLANTEVVQGNMAQLRIIATGNKVAFPNITQIGAAKVVGKHQGQSNSFSYVNGKSESKHTTVLTLTFAPQKDMTIPSYSVNIDGTAYKTQALKLKVVKSNAPQVGNSNKFSLLMRTDKKSVMVGESLLVTVFFSLQNGVRLSESPQYTKPVFKGFFVKEIGQEKAYRKDNRQVSELKYILTPQSEGNFTLDPARAKLGVSDTSRKDMFGRFFGTVWTPIVSNTLKIEVKQKPEDTDLVGHFTLKSHIDKKSTKANKPVNLSVKIEGEGSLEDFEFPDYEIDGVTIYSDDAKIETKIVGNRLKSTYVKSFVFISEQDFIIPERSISVYDIKKSEVKHLDIATFEITVEAKKAVVPVATTPNKEAVQSSVNEKKAMIKEKSEKSVTENKSVAWWMLLIAFVLGVLAMYLWQFIPKWNRKKSPFKESEALKILYAHITQSPEVEEMVRKLYAKKNGDTSIEIDKKILREMVERFS